MTNFKKVKSRLRDVNSIKNRNLDRLPQKKTVRASIKATF